MSCNNREWGTVILPKAEIARVKKIIVEDYNNNLGIQYAFAVRLHRNGFAGKPIDNIVDAVEAMCGYKSNYVSDNMAVALDYVRFRTRKPAQKDFKPVLSRGDMFIKSDLMTIEIKDNVLAWDTDTGNHQVEYAHKSELYKSMMGALNKVKFTRGTGGKLYYEDEYSMGVVEKTIF